MDLSDIELIKTVAHAGSLSEASKRLNQSQPTLSRKLMRLEDSLKTQLFHRSPKGLLPTEIAQYIIGAATPLNAHLRSITRYVELASQRDIGSLNVGVGPIIEQIMLPGVLERFVATTGDVEVSVVTEDERTLLKMFYASELDVVIGPIDIGQNRRKSFVTKSMISDKIVAVANARHPVFGYKTINAGVLEQFSLAVPKTQGSIKQSKNAPTLPKPKVVFDNYDILKRLAVETDLISAGPRAVFKDEIDAKQLRIINLNLEIFWESALLVRPEVLATPLVKHFVNLCETAARTVQDKNN
ncbi:MAG: LysR family transcriptional regulator [Pseudomonadota bacterium]